MKTIKKWHFAFSPNLGDIDSADQSRVISDVRADELRIEQSDKASARGFLDDRALVLATEYNRSGAVVAVDRCTKYDRLDWFIRKDWVDFIEFEDGAQGLYRSDDGHIVRFDPMPEVDRQQIANIVLKHMCDMYIELSDAYSVKADEWDYYSPDLTRQITPYDIVDQITNTLLEMGYPESEARS